MTAARLSPAASLLRNSKLFALPPAIALPNPEPSSEQVPRSNTATPIYPTRAAIETPLTSLNTGDWGFKRPLPLKSTTKSSSPTVRLNKGIDTAEHIADFDSAADHVLTLKKFQELNQSIQHPRKSNDRDSTVHYGAFRRGYDNTTNLHTTAPAHLKYSGVWPNISPVDLQAQLPEDLRSNTQPQTSTEIAPKLRRWRFEGPSLVQMSGLEFDQWIKTLDTNKRKEFREAVKQDLLKKKRNAHMAKAQDEGTVGEVDPSTLQVSDEEVTEHMKRLRQQPRDFGRLIANFLDLPEGPMGESVRINQVANVWEYGRRTLSTDQYGEIGPPRTHPSAGLSYIHSDRWAANHALFGPQEERLPVVARAIKIRAKVNKNVGSLGVAGFVVEREGYKGTKDRGGAGYSPVAFEPQPGGQKTVVKPMTAEIDEKGALRLVVKETPEYHVENERAVHQHNIANPQTAAMRPSKGRRIMAPLGRQQRTIEYKKRDDLVSDSDDIVAFLGKN